MLLVYIIYNINNLRICKSYLEITLNLLVRFKLNPNLFEKLYSHKYINQPFNWFNPKHVCAYLDSYTSEFQVFALTNNNVQRKKKSNTPLSTNMVIYSRVLFVYLFCTSQQQLAPNLYGMHMKQYSNIWCIYIYIHSRIFDKPN